MKQLLRKTGVLLCALLWLLIPAFSAAAEPADEAHGVFALLDEPDTTSDDIYFYRGKEKVSPADFTWASGHGGGQAVRLYGGSEYLRVATAVVKDLEEFSLSFWVLRESDTDLTDEALFCFYKNENHYLLLTPHAEDSSVLLNGIRLTWADRDFDTVDLYKKAAAGRSFSLPIGEWHHVIITAGKQRVALYIDGTPYLQNDMSVLFSAADMEFSDLGLRNFQIGADLNKKSFLHALIDDVCLYSHAFDDRQALLAYQGKDPLSAAEPDKPTETTVTAPTAATSAADTQDDGESSGISPVLILIAVLVVLAIIVLSVFLSLRQKRRNIAAESTPGTDDENVNIPLIIDLPASEEETPTPAADSEEDPT